MKINKRISINKIKDFLLFIPRKIVRRLLRGVINRLELLESKSIAQNDFMHSLVNQTLVNQNVGEKEPDIQKKVQEIQSEITEIKGELSGDANVKYIIYFHGGSKNHGCEALARTVIKSIKASREEILLHSFRSNEDIEYNMNKIVKYIQTPRIKDDSKKIVYAGSAIFNEEDMGLTDVLPLIGKNAIAISIGGDNYCYGKYVNDLQSRYNEKFHEENIKTALIGCSIEKEVLDDYNVLQDLNKYDLIVARESITYNNLLQAGINKNTFLIPDTAFLLNKEELPLPNNFIINNTIGLNVSPLVQNIDNKGNIIFENYKKLMDYIIKNTKYNVALIPHVCWEGSNDLEALTPLYNLYVDTGRVSLINECNAEQLKGFINRCRAFIGARTHATIAAYSTYVPTIVLGYSVKSKGIATDLFGTYDKYVVSVQDLKENDELLKAYLWLEENYNEIKQKLENKIPEYINSTEADIYNCVEKLKKEGKITTHLPNKKDCSGCTACVNICPKNCIIMEEDAEGFKYPKINFKECIKCNACSDTCPQNNKSTCHYHTNALAVKNKNMELKLNSSSGGVFGQIAKYVLDNNGAVFGAVHNTDMEVEHIMINKKIDISKMQGSKYVQSDLKKVFREVKRLLDKNIFVLFTGVPCQIKGLKSFLGKREENLICIDVICHGVPSPKVFRKYIEELEKNNNSKVIDFKFRNKDNGWQNFSNKISFENDNEMSELHSDNVYMKGFLNNLYLRPSCYRCTANNFTSGSDITLGDYWGINGIHNNFNDDKGCSLVLLNTNLGKEIFDKVSNEFEIIETDINYAIKYNPCIVKAVNSHKNREIFFEDIDSQDIDIIKNIENNLDI